MKANKLYRVKLVKVETKIVTLKRIDALMSKKDKKRTGLSKLTPKELVNLGSWLDGNGVAPGPINEEK